MQSSVICKCTQMSLVCFYKLSVFRNLRSVALQQPGFALMSLACATTKESIGLHRVDPAPHWLQH